MTFAGPPTRFNPRARPPSRTVKIICILVNIASAAVIGYAIARWIGG